MTKLIEETTPSVCINNSSEKIHDKYGFKTSFLLSLARSTSHSQAQNLVFCWTEIFQVFYFRQHFNEGKHCNHLCQ